MTIFPFEVLREDRKERLFPFCFLTVFVIHVNIEIERIEKYQAEESTFSLLDFPSTCMYYRLPYFFLFRPGRQNRYLRLIREFN